MLAAASDLKWLMADNEVDTAVQEVIFHNRFNRTALFKGLGESRMEVKDMLKDHMGLDASEGLAARAQVATVLASWEACKDMISRETTARAEARASRIVRPVGIVEHQAMRQAYEAQYGKLTNSQVPSKHYLGLKGEDVEEDDPKAEDLAEVGSKNDQEVDVLGAALDETGRLVVKKVIKNGRQPEDPEEFRAKLQIMQNCWLFLKTKHSNRSWLADMDDRVFGQFADHVLGGDIYGIKASGSGGDTVGPSWKMVLKYQQEVRKKACEFVSEGQTLRNALRAAWQLTSLRDLYIVTPMALAPMQQKRAQPDRAWDDVRKKKHKHNGGSPGKGGSPGGSPGKNKGGGNKGGSPGKKGKGGQIDAGRKKNKVEGKPICYAWNNEGESCNGSCGMAHVCQWCLSTEHPAYKCTKKQD